MYAMVRSLFASMAFVVALISDVAVADPIRYTFQGNLSGNLNGEDFVLAPANFTLLSDTDLVFQPSPTNRPSLFTTPFSTLSFVLNGSAGTFTSLFQAFSITVAGNGLVGFTEFDSNDIFDVNDDGLIGYDLKTSIGPIFNSPLDFLNFDTPLLTSLGELVFFDDENASIAFTAQILSPVPEPGNWTMIIAGVSILGIMVRRRRGFKTVATCHSPAA